MVEDFDALLPAHLAAARVGISRQAFNYWRATGRVTPAAQRAGRALYRLGDVLAAEAAIRAVPRGPRARIARHPNSRRTAAA